MAALEARSTDYLFKLRLTKNIKRYIERLLQGDVLLANEHQPSLAICRSRRYMPKRSTHMQCSQRSARNSSNGRALRRSCRQFRSGSAFASSS